MAGTEIIMKKITRIRGNTLCYVISPISLALISLLPLLFTYLTPTDLYEYYARENALYSRSVALPFFYCSCVTVFIFGAYLTGDGVYASSLRNPKVLIPIRAIFSSLFILVFCTLLALASLYIIYKNSPGLIDLLINKEGTKLKESLNTEGAFTQAQPLLIAVLSWVHFRSLQLSAFLRSGARRVIHLLVWIGYLVAMAISILKVARYEMIPILIQIMVIQGYIYGSRKYVNIPRLVGMIIFGLLIVGTIFGLFSFLRGADDFEKLAESFIGYGPASFNHLAAMLDGTLIYKYGGTGVYSFNFIGFVPLLHNFIDFAEIFGMPDSSTAFLAEFIDTRNSGLNPSYIWVTAFGYAFADFGYFVFFYIFALGLFIGRIWRSFTYASAFGLVLYPFFAGTIMLWFSFNVLPRPQLVTFVAVALIASIIERIFTLKKAKMGSLTCKERANAYS